MPHGLAGSLKQIRTLRPSIDRRFRLLHRPWLDVAFGRYEGASKSPLSFNSCILINPSTPLQISGLQVFPPSHTRPNYAEVARDGPRKSKVPWAREKPWARAWAWALRAPRAIEGLGPGPFEGRGPRGLPQALKGTLGTKGPPWRCLKKKHLYNKLIGFPLVLKHFNM